jgi:hypothetical protein
MVGISLDVITDCKPPQLFGKATTARIHLYPQSALMNLSVIEMSGVGTVRCIESRRKDKAARKTVLRRHWPRLRMVAGQLVMSVEK